MQNLEKEKKNTELLPFSHNFHDRCIPGFPFKDKVKVARPQEYKKFVTFKKNGSGEPALSLVPSTGLFFLSLLRAKSVPPTDGNKLALAGKCTALPLKLHQSISPEHATLIKWIKELEDSIKKRKKKKDKARIMN